MSIKEKLQDLKDSIIPRKLGYVQLEALEALPKSQKLASCYCPISHITSPNIYKELYTDDCAASVIKSIKKIDPQFEGLIFDPMVGPISDVKQAMQMYASKYNLPVASNINTKIEIIKPVRDNNSNNAIAHKMKSMQQND